MKALLTLTKIEMKLAIREFSGVLFGILLPLGLMILMGFIYGEKAAHDGAGYTMIQQTFPAVSTIGIAAFGLMALPLALADYRDKKILKRLKVTPTKPFLILCSQGLNALLFTLFSLGIVWIAARLVFNYEMIGSASGFLGIYFLTLASMISMGFFIASVSKSVKSANLMTTLIYFPMFFVSGATIPYEIMPAGLQFFADLMPLTHGIKLLKISSLQLPLEGVTSSVVYLIVTTVVCTIVSLKTFRWE
jgi:ABC-2 type transport system permease protein